VCVCVCACVSVVAGELKNTFMRMGDPRYRHRQGQAQRHKACLKNRQRHKSLLPKTFFIVEY
jgi:hypothetical protein